MNYLTDRLPRPNYSPVKFKATRQITKSVVLERKLSKGNS